MRSASRQSAVVELSGARDGVYGIGLSQRRARQVLLLALTVAQLVALPILLVTPAVAADRHAAFVVDGNTGDVLRAEQADEPRYPASLTKMMTLYLAFEAIEAGRASYTTRISVSQEAASQAPTKLDLDPGETIQLIDAMKALITKSANDMAVAIGEHLGGSHARFAELMTDKARLLGMSRTTFRNANGLPDPGQITTARDMVTLALRLHDDFPTHYQLFAIKSFNYGRSSYRNHNNLLFNFQGTEGIKTGYTRASGFNLVASVRRGSRHVIGAVFGGSSSSRRDDTMRLMLSHALIKASPLKTRRPAPVLVAQARPAQRPAPRPEATPIQVATAATTEPRPESRPESRPEPRSAPRAAAMPEPRRTAAPALQSEPVVAPQQAPMQPAASQVTIDVARVKPVMVPLRSRSSEPTPQVAAATPMAAPALATTLAAARIAPKSAPPQVAEPKLVRQIVPAPVPTAVAFASPPPVSSALVTSSTGPIGAGRGAAPSTLEQQAANLARGAQPVAAAPAQPAAAAIRFAQASATPRYLRGPSPAAPTTVPAATGGFEVQIGAYASQAEADRALAAAGTTAADLLAAHPGRSILVQTESRQLYRARLTGFNSNSAASTCLELRRRQIDCFVMKAQ